MRRSAPSARYSMPERPHEPYQCHHQWPAIPDGLRGTAGAAAFEARPKPRIADRHAAAPRDWSHISLEAYRSFRELSLAGSVDLVTWCPPTFVGNSGIERSNGHRGFALLFFSFVAADTTVIPRERGVSNTPQLRGSITSSLEYRITRFRG